MIRLLTNSKCRSLRMGNILTGLCLALLLNFNGKVVAQSASFGSSYAYGGGITSIIGQHDFQNGSGTISQGIIGSERASNSAYGFLQGASWLNAADNAFIDGYAKTYGTGAFTFPIGDNGKYRPAAVSAASTASPASAAYYGVDPTTAVTSALQGGNEVALPAGAPFAITAIGVGISAVTNKEYWDIKGAIAAKISLTWDATSAIGTLTSSTLANLTIVGWNGTQWVKIPSTVDATSILGGASTTTVGSITTDAALTPDTYTVYSFASSATCPTPTVGGTVAYGGGTVCTASNIGTVMLTGNTGDVVRWETSTNGGGAWSPITSVNAYYNFANAANAQQYRAVVNNGGSCLDAYATPATIATSAAACTNTTCDNLTGNVTINMTTPPSLATYDSKIIFTNASGVIQYVSANNATTLSGVAVGDYLVYQVLNDPTQLPLPTLTVGTNITAIGGACTKFSNQLAYKVCVCAAGTTAPSVSLTTLNNACPITTANLSTITASNLPAGSKLTWHTATPATLANRVPDSTAVATAGTYYAAFTDFVNQCTGGSATTAVTVTITSPCAATFTFNCGSATSTGTFVANGTAGQAGTVVIPMTGTTAGTATFTVTGTGFTGTLSTTLTAGQTSVSVPITYDGTGAARSQALTIASSQGTGSCSTNVTVSAQVATFTFNCGSATSTGTFISNGTAGQAGTVVLPLTSATAGTASFTVTGTGFTGTLSTTLAAGQTSVTIPITFDGTGVVGSRTLTVSSAQGTGTCTPSVSVLGVPDLTTTIGQPSPALVVGQPSNLPITVANIGNGAAPGIITTTITLPSGVTAPPTFTNNGWTCSTSAPTVTCTNPSPIAAGGSSLFNVPVTPDATTVGTKPIFNGSTDPVTGETNIGNNNAAPLTPAVNVQPANCDWLPGAIGK